MTTSLLEGLNAPQQEAVVCTEGPVLILAGAGSGKTKTLSHRYAYLLREQHVSPYEILCVTFTNKAAREMRERVARLLGFPEDSDVQLPWLGTFHSICVRILRRELDKTELGITSRFVIYDDQDSLTAVKRAMETLKLDPKQYNPRALLNGISGAKNELLTPDGYRQFAVGPWQSVVCSVYEKYQAILRQANALDFDDILMLTLRLFETYPDVLHSYQERFRYIMVDEYQDTNRAQYLLVNRLAAVHKNLFVIGDDWQSVYSWRGADFRNILNFRTDYPDVQEIKLEQNYRSTQTILDASQAVIQKNEQRSDKLLWTEGPKGAPITVVQCLNEKDEGEFIMREAKGLVAGHAYTGVHSYDDCVVLYRTNAQSRLLEETFVRFNMPYRIVGGVGFYQRKEVKDVLAYARLIMNPQDLISVERVLNVPPRGIGPKTLSQVREIGVQHVDQMPPKALDFFLMIRGLQEYANDKAPAEILEKIVEYTKYKEFLLDGTIEGETRWENVRELIGVASRTENLEEFLEQVALVQDVEEQAEHAEAEDLGAITLMTVHAAKGLEFPVVFLAGMEEGIFPHSRSLSEKQEMEEERRLAYVGMTRAKARLYLLYASERRLYGMLQVNPPSRFINDIPEEYRETI